MLTPPGGCGGEWSPNNHVLYQAAHAAVLLGYLAPNSQQGALVLHGAMCVGFLLLSAWAWAVLCAPDVFSWNFSFMVINCIQVMFIIYRLKRVKFSPDLENVYLNVFLPINVSRKMFAKLAAPEHCGVVALQPGDTYAVQNTTRTDSLALLVAGTANVLCSGQLLHHIEPLQFLDSPEYESTSRLDEKFKVTIMAVTSCSCLCWQRQTLDFMFIKEPYLATVVGHLVARDVVNKLYIMNNRVKPDSSLVDLRLPAILPLLREKRDQEEPPEGDDPIDSAPGVGAHLLQVPERSSGGGGPVQASPAPRRGLSLGDRDAFCSSAASLLAQHPRRASVRL